MSAMSAVSANESIGMDRVDALRAAFAPADRTVPALLGRQSKRFGDRALFVARTTKGDATTLRFADAPAFAARAAGMLVRAGVGRGDRVALFCGNRIEFLQVFLGSAWAGAVCVPVNTAAKAPQLSYLLANSGAKLLVIEDTFAPVLTLLDRTSLALEAIWVIGNESTARQRQAASIEPMPLPSPADPIDAAVLAPGDDLAILYTSGTTGPSKGVRCPHAQFFWWAAHSAELLALETGDVLHTSLPLFHVNALNTLFQALVTGSTQVVEPRFSVSGYWPAMQASGATVTYLLGAMVPMLLSRPADPDLERGHRIRVALAPGAPPALVEPFRIRTGIELLDGYGSTETNFVIGTRTSERRTGTMGVVRKGFHARVVDADDEPLADGTAGELVLRADDPFAFASGYHGMPEKTIEAWRNLWFHTGDRVVRDADGHYRFVDRLKEVIRRRGENISSFEVEQVLLAHPDVASAAAYAVGSELGEDEVMVAIVVREGATLEAVQLMDFCKPRLPYFAMPRFIEFLAELPRTESGKVRKFLLRERGVTAQTWDREAAGYAVR